MIFVGFESILLQKDNGKQYLDESYTNKHQKHVGCTYGYKLLCVDDKFSKPFKSYLGEDAVYNFINGMIEESKSCSDVMKKHFNKELVITKTDVFDFKNSTKCCNCDNVYVDGDVKVRDHCHFTGKYRASRRGDCSIKFKLNHKISVVSYNLKMYDYNVIMQEIGKFNFKINVISNGLQKYMSFNINNEIVLLIASKFKFFIR